MFTVDTLRSGDLVEIGAGAQPTDLKALSERINDWQYKQYFLADAGREHYKLLAAAGSLFSGNTIFDIGTHFGLSSLALSHDANVRVVSYDIVEMKRLNSLPENVTYKIGDFREDPDVLNSPFIFIDVDPHDGIQEINFHNFFLEKEYKGIVLWDDIMLNAEMLKFWNSIENPKYNLTAAGHWSGTGMVLYG